MIYGLDYNCSRLKGMLLTGVQVYRKFYTKEEEMSNGVLAISVSKLPLQPCNLLAGMLFVSISFCILRHSPPRVDRVH